MASNTINIENFLFHAQLDQHTTSYEVWEKLFSALSSCINLVDDYLICLGGEKENHSPLKNVASLLRKSKSNSFLIDCYDSDFLTRQGYSYFSNDEVQSIIGPRVV